jgi:hypothetical protein
MLYLGFEICTCRMIVAWPRSKHLVQQLGLTTLLSACRPICTPCMAALLLDKIRLASQIAPWGVYVSLSLWASLTHVVRGGSHHQSLWAR